MGESWLENCRAVAQTLLANRGWLLGDRFALADAVCVEFGSANAPRPAIERATIRYYCRVLHSACSDKGSSRQRRAFMELWSFLFPIAKHRVHSDPDLAEDLAQEALIKTWKNLAKCKDQGSFLNYAAFILVNLIRDHYRKAFKKQGEPGEENWVATEVPVSQLGKAEAEYDLAQSNPLADAPDDSEIGERLDEASRKELRGTVETCVKIDTHRRVLQELLKDKAYKEIAERLSTTVRNVYVWRNRAINALRNCEEFLLFLEKRLLE